MVTNRRKVELNALGETRVIRGKTYKFYNVCQPHNCPENAIYVLFEQGGSHAWIFFTKDEDHHAFLVILTKKCKRHLEPWQNHKYSIIFRYKIITKEQVEMVMHTVLITSLEKL